MFILPRTLKQQRLNVFSTLKPTSTLRISSLSQNPRPSQLQFRRNFQKTASEMGSHGDFKTIEASRPDFEANESFYHTKTVKPDWKVGDGANDPSWKDHKTVEIDPYGNGRTSFDNYKLLISGIIPRPVSPPFPS